MHERQTGSIVDAIIAQTSDGPIASRIRPAVPGSPDDLLQRAPDFAQGRKKKRRVEFENPDRSKWARGLPELTNDFRVRFNPLSGEIIMVSYPRDSKELDLAKERWVTYPDLETSIRTAGHIVDEFEFEGNETRKMDAISELTHDTYRRVEEKKLTSQEDIDSYLAYALSLLEESGISRVRVANKKMIKNKLTKVIDDITNGKENDLIKQTVLAATVIGIVMEEMIADDIVTKYGELEKSVLFPERNRERLLIQSVIERGNKFLRIPEDFEDIARHIKRFERFANIILNPEKVKAAPYRGPALFFLSFMFGFPKRRDEIKPIKRMLKRMYSEEAVQMLDDIHNGENAEDSNSPEIFRRRLTIGLEILRTILEQGEKNL